MSMFSFPADMNMNEMMKPMTAMTDLSKAADMQVAPLMVYPMGAAAAATAVGFGMAGQMTGLMMGAMQAAMQSQTSALGAKPDLSWLVPTLAEDLAPEELDEAPAADHKASAAKAKTPAPKAPAPKTPAAKTADIVELKPAAKAAEAAPGEKPSEEAPAAAKTAAAKPKSAAKAPAAKPASPKGDANTPAVKATPAQTPKPAEAAKDGAVAAVEKLKSDAETAAAAASEATSAIAVKQAKPAAALEPEDYRRPSEIEKPGAPDDLKLISGVGPKLEQVLNGLGVWTFAQIADWKAEEIAWVDDYLQFKGRIDRDDWVSQARALAKGGISA